MNCPPMKGRWEQHLIRHSTGRNTLNDTHALQGGVKSALLEGGATR